MIKLHSGSKIIGENVEKTKSSQMVKILRYNKIILQKRDAGNVNINT